MIEKRNISKITIEYDNGETSEIKKGFIDDFSSADVDIVRYVAGLLRRNNRIMIVLNLNDDCSDPE